MAGFETTVGLIGLMAPRSLTRGDQEYLLDDLRTPASLTAASCVHAGQAERAVELLEQGRGILLGQALDTRADLTELAARHPDLARRFTALRDELDRADDHSDFMITLPTPAGEAADDSAERTRQETDKRRAAAQAFDRLIADIRAKPGFAGFLRPIPVRDLATAAADGPIVIVNVSQFGSHVLILTSNGVLEPIPLDDVSPERVDSEVTGFLNAVNGAVAARESEDQLTATLGWLWDTIASPVLDRLGLTGPPPAGQAWPRLWWCLPGLMSFLPLHAAGHHGTRFDAFPQTTADRVVSSYTPTIRALLHARRANLADGSDGDHMPTRDGDIMVVAMPETPCAGTLPSAQAESNTIRRRFPGQARVLTGSDATYATVTRALPRARWAHFACHASADLTNPSASCLLLDDYQQQPLTVVAVARLRLERADLAFLSACSTAQPGTRLTDEAIHLASAFQLAGYRHVIGTLWPVRDTIATRIVSDVYAALATSGTSTAATALHTVTRRLRDRSPHTPTAWASHIHAGP